MKLPRDLSGPDLIKVLCKHFGYHQINQEGSHIILETNTPQHHRLAVPNHSSLRLGTLNAILNAVARAKATQKSEILEKL